MQPARRHSSRYGAGSEKPAAAPHGPLAVVAGWLRKIHQLKTEHQFLGRYSIDKLEAFHEYQTNARWWRVALVLAATPVPTLLVLLAMDAVPMADPRDGASRNVVCFVRTVLSHGLMTFVCLLPARQALRLHDSGNYSLWKVALIGLLTCVALESVFIPLAFTWRFPVPFRELLGVPVWCTLVVLLHVWLAPRVFSRRPRRTRVYLVVVSTQITILYGFLAASLGFAQVPMPAQVAMIACFPIVKIAIKRFVWTYARQLDDISTDVTICMVEISGSLYQTVCLQFATSKAIGVVILVTDLAQALFEVHAYLATEYLADGRSSLATAMAIVQSSVFPGADERPSLAHYSSTASVAESQSASRRHSGTFALGGGVAIRRRPLKAQTGSVFMQPKIVKTRASKRLMDLRQIDFDLLDFASPRADIQPPANEDPVVHDDDEAENGTDSMPASLTRPFPSGEPDSASTPGPGASTSVDATLAKTDELPSDSEPGVSRPLQTPHVPTQLSPALIRGASRTAVHTDFAAGSAPRELPPLQITPARLSKPFGTASSAQLPPNPPTLVGKSTSSSALTSPAGGAQGSIVEWALGIPQRLLLHRKLSDNSTHPEPPAEASQSSPPRRSSTTSSLSRVLPSQVSPPVAPPPTSSAPSTARHSSPPSGRPSGTQTRPSLAFTGRSTSFDRRRRSSDGGCGVGGSAAAVTIDGVQVARRDQARILEQTLQLLFSCEVLVFVEYMEVVMPVLYAACVGTEWALPNGRFNLITMTMDQSAVVAAVGGSVLYALLELLSLLVLNYVVWRKYGVSAAHLLAFVLETYAFTLQGKLVGAFIVIINTATVHQGVDFSFRLDYDALLGPRAG